MNAVHSGGSELIARLGLQVVRIEFPGDAMAAASGAPTIAKQLAATGKAEIYGIYFDFASDRIKEESEPVLIEIYRTPADPVRHKASAHYATWRDTVAPMMAEPRRGVTYHALFPEPAEWERPR